MKSKTTSKKGIYFAMGYVALLVGLSLPVGVAGIKLLNFVIGHLS